MQLFKRLLLSLFPDQTTSQGINPASMFISFISTKEFFSVINRKIVENYKINLFDISIDPFEFKIGLGENAPIKQKDIDNYYGYCVSANMNGYRFYNPTNIGNCITLITSIYTKDCFEDEEQNYFLNFLYTTYLLFFVFTAKIKNFPFTNKEENYNRFIEVFFNFYEFIFQQTGDKIDKSRFNNIKKKLLNNINVFFMLFYSYQKYNKLLCDQNFPDKEFYNRLFNDEIKPIEKAILNDFSENIEKYSTRATFGQTESKLLQYILPADILLRYLFLETNMSSIIDNIISKLYNKETIDKYLKSFLKTDNERNNFINYISDYKHFKKNFFSGVQKYIINTLKKEGIDDLDDDFDENNSRIGDDEDEKIENFKVPEKIRRESKIMEKILNFFITALGGFWIARGESYFLKLQKPEIIKELINSDFMNLKESTLQIYGGLLYSYGKNLFYYKYISENVRNGRQKFFIPIKSNLKNTYSNFHILRLMDENALAIILQDINPKDIKIYNKNKNLITIFKEKFSENISKLVQLDNKEFIEAIYKDIENIFTNKNLTTILNKHLNQDDLYHIKENLYNIDFQISRSYYKECKQELQKTNNTYDNGLLEIYAQHKETLLGFLIFLTKICQKFDIQRNFLINLYNQNIAHIDKKNIKIRNTIIENLYIKHQDIIKEILTVDDNPEFLKIGEENRIRFNKKQSNTEITKKISGEDCLWLKGYLKNITYYNKRFFIPK